MGRSLLKPYGFNSQAAKFLRAAERAEELKRLRANGADLGKRKQSDMLKEREAIENDPVRLKMVGEDH